MSDADADSRHILADSIGGLVGITLTPMDVGGESMVQVHMTAPEGTVFLHLYMPTSFTTGDGFALAGMTDHVANILSGSVRALNEGRP